MVAPGHETPVVVAWGASATGPAVCAVPVPVIVATPSVPVPAAALAIVMVDPTSGIVGVRDTRIVALIVAAPPAMVPGVQVTVWPTAPLVPVAELCDTIETPAGMVTTMLGLKRPDPPVFCAVTVMSYTLATVAWGGFGPLAHAFDSPRVRVGGESVTVPRPVKLTAPPVM